MPASPDALARLESSLGAESAAGVLRRLAPVPGALEWLRENAVIEALAALAAGESPVTRALFAITGVRNVEALMGDLAPPLASRRDALLAPDPDPSASGSPDDVLVLTRELILADRGNGAKGVAALLTAHDLDWMAPLACAWESISSRDEVVALAVVSHATGVFPAVVAALRSSGPDESAARVLLRHGAGDAAAIVARLLALGETSLAAAVAAVEAEGHSGVKSASGGVSPTRAVLYREWEARRAGLADLAEAIASAAEAESDYFSALEARRQALQLDPSETRLASVALTHVKAGESSDALALLPDTSECTDVQMAAGMAYIHGGAIEKGRPLLVDGVTSALLEGRLAKAEDIARTLVKSGEVGLALDVLQAHLGRRPGDISARRLLADLLLEAGDPAAALAEARLLRSIDDASAVSPLLEARAWIETERPEKALPILRVAMVPDDASSWRKTIECAIAAAAFDEVDSLLAGPPSDIEAAELAVLGAKVLEAHGRKEDAEAALQSATLEHPSSPGPWLVLASIQERTGRNDEAGETLRRGAQIAGSSQVHASLARWLRIGGRTSEALEAAQAALQAEPKNAEAHFELGASLLALGRAPAALESLREAHRAMPARQDVRLVLASAFEACGEADVARRLFSHLPENAPAEAWFTAGRLELSAAKAVDASRAQIAVSRLLRARSVGSEEATLNYWLGLGFENSRQPARAAEAYQVFLATHPRDPAFARRAVMGKAASLLELDRAIESIPDLEALCDQTSEDAEARLALARACAAALLPDEAARAAEHVLRNDPAQREALSILSAAAQRTGRWNGAFEALRLAAEHVGRDPELWLGSAQAALRVGNRDQALKGVETALSLDPDGAARRKAAFTLVDLGDHRRALDLLHRAALDDASDPGLWLEVADVAERARDTEKALGALQRASALVPADAEVHARRASILAAAGRGSESITAWRTARGLRPQDARIHRSLAKALIDGGEVQAGLDEFSGALAEHPLDADLLAAAGLAALRLGSAQEAIDLLTRADRAAPDMAEVVVGLAEAWLRLRRAPNALEVLDRSGHAIETSPSGWALRAEACLSTGDLIGAEEALNEARRWVGGSAPDRIALSRAEMRFGHWQNAIDTLALFRTDPDPEAEEALAEIVVRTYEARWLFGAAAQAERHAPGSQVPGEAVIEWLDVFLSSGEDADARKRLLRLRRDLILGPETDETALEALREACDANRPAEAAHEALAIGALRRRRPADALQVLKSIEPDDLGPSWQAVLAGIAHLQNGNTRLALAALEDAARDAALRPLALGLYAQAAIAADDARGAIGALNQAISQWPDEPAWQSALAALYHEAKMPDAALPHLQTAAELEPENGLIQLSLARAMRDHGHAGDALQAFDRALALQAHDPTVWNEAGEVAIASGDAARAGGYFGRALDLAPQEPRPMLGAARAALLDGDLRRARRHAEKALEAGGESCDVLRCLAEIAARQGEPDRALEMFDRAMAVADDRRSLRLARARLLIHLGRSADAADDLRLCLSEDAEDEAAWHALSLATEASGDLTEAVHASESAVRLSPRSMTFRLQLARLARATGHLDRALDEIQQAQAIDPLDPQAALELGRVYEARREFDRALEAYQRSAEIDPDSAEAFRRAGSVLKSLKAYRDAGRMLERAAEIEPTDARTLQQLAAVRALELVHGETYSMAVNP